MHRPALRAQRLAQGAHEAQEACGVEGEGGSAAGVGGGGVRQGGQLGAREVVAVQGHEGGDAGLLGAAGLVLAVEIVEAASDEAGEGGFAWDMFILLGFDWPIGGLSD